MNHAIKTVVSTFGVILGLSGFNHGLFEALQGNAPTPGLIIQAIGPANRMWLHGTEEAFSIIPNFLVTGILAMVVAIIIMIWSARFLQTKHGSTVLFCCLWCVPRRRRDRPGCFFLPVWHLQPRSTNTGLVAKSPTLYFARIPGKALAVYPGGCLCSISVCSRDSHLRLSPMGELCRAKTVFLLVLPGDRLGNAAAHLHRRNCG